MTTTTTTTTTTRHPFKFMIDEATAATTAAIRDPKLSNTGWSGELNLPPKNVLLS